MQLRMESSKGRAFDVFIEDITGYMWVGVAQSIPEAKSMEWPALTSNRAIPAKTVNCVLKTLPDFGGGANNSSTLFLAVHTPFVQIVPQIQENLYERHENYCA